jgi:hypothetical protein
MHIDNRSLKQHAGFGKGETMKNDTDRKVSKEQEVTISFDMGLEMAVFVLEMAEGLSPEERKNLIELLKKNIGQSEPASPSMLLEAISK